MYANPNYKSDTLDYEGKPPNHKLVQIQHPIKIDETGNQIIA
jgi:hypothetical protein